MDLLLTYRRAYSAAGFDFITPSSSVMTGQDLYHRGVADVRTAHCGCSNPESGLNLDSADQCEVV